MVTQRGGGKTNDKSGKYAIGFSDQKQRYFHVKLGKKTVIGGFENIFGRRSEFCYKALNHIDAYGLRKEKLKPIMDEFPEFKTQIATYMVNFYYRIVRKPMLEFKRNILSQVRKRQELDIVMREMDAEISAAKQQYEVDLQKFATQDESKAEDDETHR